MLRRSLVLVLLFVHAVAVAHLAFVAHVTGDSGAVVDAQPSCPQPGHGSSGVAHGHQLEREETECQAFALVRGAAPAPVAFVAVSSVTSPWRFTVRSAEARPPVEVLSVAPKSSPPV